MAVKVDGEGDRGSGIGDRLGDGHGIVSSHELTSTTRPEMKPTMEGKGLGWEGGGGGGGVGGDDKG